MRATYEELIPLLKASQAHVDAFDQFLLQTKDLDERLRLKAYDCMAPRKVQSIPMTAEEQKKNEAQFSEEEQVELKDAAANNWVVYRSLVVKPVAQHDMHEIVDGKVINVADGELAAQYVREAIEALMTDL